MARGTPDGAARFAAAARAARDHAAARLAANRAARAAIEAEAAAIRIAVDPTEPDAYTCSGAMSARQAHRRRRLAELMTALAAVRADEEGLARAAAIATGRAQVADKISRIDVPKRRR